MAVRAVRKPLSQKDRQLMDRVARAKKAEIKWDEFGLYAEKCGDLAKRVGVDAGVLYEEHCERSAIRHYAGGVSVTEAERLAWGDVLERFTVTL